jgi:hypothetical protein
MATEEVADQIECTADDLGNTMMPECYSYLFHMSYMQAAFAFTGCGKARCRFHPSLARHPLTCRETPRDVAVRHLLPTLLLGL